MHALVAGMRRQPVAFFLGDAAFMADPKFRALGRRLTDPDAFNSAVGAFFVALAAARRNGLPCLDVEAETASSFVPDLIAVGLLTPDGFPGKAFQEWAPARPKRPSESDASSVSDASNVSSSSEMHGDVASTPLPSLPILSDVRGVQGGNDGRADLEAFLEVKYRVPTPAQRTFMDGYVRTFDLTGPERAARLILANPTDPIGALKRDLAEFRDKRAAEARASEVPKPKARPAGTSALVTSAHNFGQHADNPLAECPYCQRMEALA